jgi:heme A synthase
VAVLSLVVWAVVTFGLAPHTGAIHLLLAVGATLLVRWWALRA